MGKICEKRGMEGRTRNKERGARTQGGKYLYWFAALEWLRAPVLNEIAATESLGAAALSLKAASLHEKDATKAHKATLLHEKATSLRLFAAAMSLDDTLLHEKDATLHLINATLRLKG